MKNGNVFPYSQSELNKVAYSWRQRCSGVAYENTSEKLQIKIIRIAGQPHSRARHYGIRCRQLTTVGGETRLVVTTDPESEWYTLQPSCPHFCGFRRFLFLFLARILIRLLLRDDIINGCINSDVLSMSMTWFYYSCEQREQKESQDYTV